MVIEYNEARGTVESNANDTMVMSLGDPEARVSRGEISG